MKNIIKLLTVCVISAALSVTSYAELPKTSADRVVKITEVAFEDNIVVDIILPRGFTVLKTDDTTKIYTIFENMNNHDVERFNIADTGGNICGAISLTVVEDANVAVKSNYDANAIYQGLGMSSMYNWNGGYTPVNKHGREGAGTTEVYYRSDIGGCLLNPKTADLSHFKKDKAYDSDADTRLNLYNKGVLAYNLDLMKYTAVEFNYDCVTDEQLTAAAKSVKIRQTAPVLQRPKTVVNFSDATVSVTLPKGYTVLDTYDADRQFAAFLSEVSGKAEQFNIADGGVIVGAISLADLRNPDITSFNPKRMYSEIMNGESDTWDEKTQTSVLGPLYTWESHFNASYEGDTEIDDNNPPAAVAPEGAMWTFVSYRYDNRFLSAEDKSNQRMQGVIINSGENVSVYTDRGILAYNLPLGKYAALEFDYDGLSPDKMIELVKSIKISKFKS